MTGKGDPYLLLPVATLCLVVVLLRPIALLPPEDRVHLHSLSQIYRLSLHAISAICLVLYNIVMLCIQLYSDVQLT